MCQGSLGVLGRLLGHEVADGVGVDDGRCACRDATPSSDSLRLAVLTALNIADELFRCRDVTDARDGELAERAGELERLLDRVLLA